jgi:hypothetical protein
LPGAIDTAYKELGRYMRQSSGLDVDEGKPNPIVARFTAYRPEMMDAAIFRDGMKKIRAIALEIQNTPESNERRQKLIAKYPNIETVYNDLQVAQSYLRDVSSRVNALEAQMDTEKIAGTLTKEDERRLIEAQNILRREQIGIYKRTTKSLIQNGFRDLVISRD